MNLDYLYNLVRDVPDWPKPGIIFKDITPLLADPKAFSYAIDRMSEHFSGMGIDIVLGAEARGFIFGGVLADRLKAGFVPARKPGKLPWNISKVEYALEYGVDTLEIHADAILPNHKVLVVDDVLATGGTAAAKVDLVEKHNATVVGLTFLIELDFLAGREKLPGRDIYSVLNYR